MLLASGACRHSATCGKEDKGVTKRDTLGGTQNLIIINESGLYSLILTLKLEQAKAFKRWTNTLTTKTKAPSRFTTLPTNPGHVDDEDKGDVS